MFYPSLDAGSIHNLHVLGLTSLLVLSAGNVTMLKIWGKEHGPWMQALHTVYGLGALVGPLICEPFLAEKQKYKNAVKNLTRTNMLIVDL